MTSGCVSNSCDGRPWSLSHRRWCTCISESFITTSMDDHGEGKRTEQNLLVRSSKSEAEVTYIRRLRSRNCTIEANYWQTWSIARPLCDSRAICHVAVVVCWVTVVCHVIVVSTPRLAFWRLFFTVGDGTAVVVEQCWVTVIHWR